jgi:hypothetical protein
VHRGDARNAARSANGSDGDAADAWRAALRILDELGHPDAVSVREKLGAG